MLAVLQCKGCEQTPCACYSEAQRVAHAHESRLERVADALERVADALERSSHARAYPGEPTEPKQKR